MPFDDQAHLDVRCLPGPYWRLLAPLVYALPSQVRDASPLLTIRVPAGFVTDFASVPRLLLWLTPRTGETAKAAVVHDYAYRVGHDRRTADAIFYRALIEDGVRPSAAWAMWAGLRIGGWWGYRRARKYQTRAPGIQHWLLLGPAARSRALAQPLDQIDA